MTASSSWQTMLREEYVEPLLPPPVIQSIRAFDAVIQEWTGIPEATITASVTVVLAWTLFTFIVWFMNYSNSSSRHQHRMALKAHTKTDQDASNSENQQPQYDATVLLTGPRNSGKTRLFYQLLQHQSTTSAPTIDQGLRTVATTPQKTTTPITVMSLQTNMDYMTIGTNTPSSASGEPQQQHLKEQIIRLIDYPGHASVSDPMYIQTITQTTTKANYKKMSRVSSIPPPPLRIVLVVDATQPVTPAAELLFQLFTILYDSYCNHPLPAIRPAIFVACHKKDVLKKAKNEKRIKIQIRTELERLIYHHSVLQQQHQTTAESSSSNSESQSSSNGWWCCPPPPRSYSNNNNTTTTSSNSGSRHLPQLAVDFDELPFVQLHFYATTCCDDTISRELFEFCTTGTVQSLP